MLNFLFTFVVLGGTFIYFDGYNKCYRMVVICKDTSIYRYQKFRKINKLVATNYKGVCTIFWISLCMILKMFWIYILQYFNNTVILQDNKYIITYVIKGKLYKMCVKPQRGPSKVLLVSDENHEDVSHLVLPYIGPEENFHSSLFTPTFFNRKELVFELSNGSEKIFTENQNIIITND